MKALFRTIVDPAPFSEKLSYQTQGLFLGSCFSSLIGKKLEALKFPVVINPSGVLYNPVSVKNTVDRLLDGILFSGEELLYENGLWFSLMHDTSFSHPDKAVCLDMINRRYEEAVSFLKSVRFLFLTFGTSWVYEWKKDHRVISNCHKLPAGYFARRMLNVDEIVSLYLNLLERLFSSHPDLQVVFTVSPIRHWKDGAVGNQYSKSVLHVAIHRLMEQDERLLYFPSYEIMMDDLRNYRFYTEDMLHISDVAVKYIWEKFRKAVLAPETDYVIREIEKVIKAMEHKPLHRQTESFRQFVKKTLVLINNLEEQYPFLDLSSEKEYFERADV